LNEIRARRLAGIFCKNGVPVCHLRRAGPGRVGACHAMIEENFSPDVHTIGSKAGGMAGQTIFHCHCHVIPRYAGDVPEPKGGVRGVVPERRGY
jgi:hypothetical protein